MNFEFSFPSTSITQIGVQVKRLPEVNCKFVGLLVGKLAGLVTNLPDQPTYAASLDCLAALCKAARCSARLW